MNIEELKNGKIRITKEGGMVRDKRNGREYSEVETTFSNLKHFE